MMNLYVYGMNHRSAPLIVREQVMIAHEHLVPALQSILNEEGILEAVIVSTCNRCELYAIADDSRRLGQWMAKQHHHGDGLYEQYTYLYSGVEALAHLLRVAIGLDAQVVGEPQILGQVKTAFAIALEAGAAGPELNRLFQQVFSSAKTIRHDTSLGAHAISGGYLTWLMMQRCISVNEPASVLLVGAGKMMASLIPYLKQAPNLKITFINRTPEHAGALWPEVPVQPMSALLACLAQCDIAVFATESHYPLVTRDALLPVLEQRMKPLYCLDLALPRNVEASVSECGGAHLFNLDDIQLLVDENQGKRQQAAVAAEALIVAHSERYQKRLENIEFDHIIKAYRRKINDLREVELAKALQKLKEGIDASVVLQEFSQALANKVMHQPSSALNEARYEKSKDWLTSAKILLGVE
ncbi:MAG: glutamyl-tRNA reductase [Gammaproteobacteria bacterium]|nr:glutamyl-tRNA reductase [Gammaproteobacteria bacterium]